MIKPLNNRIVIELDKSEKTTASGLIIITDDKIAAMVGTVVVGNDTVKKGDRVAVSKYGIDEVSLDSKSYLIVSDFSILATL